MKKVWIDVLNKKDVEKIVEEKLDRELINLYQEFEKLRERMFDVEKLLRHFIRHGDTNANKN